MNPIILREGGPSRFLELQEHVADALKQANVLQVGPTETRRVWELAAGTQIGVVNVDGQQVVIEPKIDINRLVFMMGYARNPRFWRDDHVSLADHIGLPEALADAFLRLTSHALAHGLLKGYVTVDETLPVLRGRIREADQVRRRWGRSLPLEVRHDDFTVDIAENQVLLAAAEQLLRNPGVSVRHRAGLQRLRMMLGDVTSPWRRQKPPWSPTRLNARYHPALQLAELILDGRSFEQRIGRVVVSGFLFNMATIFEDFVTTALKEALKPFGGRSWLQYGTHLDEGELVSIRPDFVWFERGRPLIVVDAKYKAEKPSGFPQADMYQMLAYCTALELPIGHLVYAKGNEAASEYVVRGSGVNIVAHTLDLDQVPSELLRAVGRIAMELVPQSMRQVGHGVTGHAVEVPSISSISKESA